VRAQPDSRASPSGLGVGDGGGGGGNKFCGVGVVAAAVGAVTQARRVAAGLAHGSWPGQACT
jgi:hypothetical protein